MFLKGLSQLNPDCGSTTDEPHRIENPDMGDDHVERSNDWINSIISKDSVTHEDQNSMIFLVKECEEVESGIILYWNSTSSSDDQLLQHKMESAANQRGGRHHEDQSEGLTAASATLTSSETQTKMKMKSSLGGGADENDQGFHTPTKFLDNKLISSVGLKCPPAPRKPKTEPLGKRKRDCRNLQLEFVKEVELVLRLVGGGDPKLKKACLTAAVHQVVEHES